MKFNLLIVFICLLSCNSSSEDDSVKSETQRGSISETKKETDSLEKIPAVEKFNSDTYCKLVDSLIRSEKLIISRYGWLENEKKLIKLNNDKADADRLYYFYQNDTGLIQYVYIAPISQSGDWAEYETYIFDPNGRTLRHEFHHSTFVSECGEARINIVRKYDLDFNLLNEEKNQTDFDEKEIKGKNCFPGLELKSFKDLNELKSLPGFRKVMEKVSGISNQGL